MSAFFRRFRLLQLIRRGERRVSTRDLAERLQGEGLDVSQRTVQRDLQALAPLFPGLESDGNPDIPGWRWNPDTEVLDLPALDPPMALTFKLVKTFLDDLIPPAVTQGLDPYFRCADNVLRSTDDSGYAHWADRVKIVPRTQPLQPAALDEELITTLYQALFESRQVRGRYRNRRGGEAEYDFHPLGLVFRESVVYLVATVWDYQDPRHYALHRFTQCTRLDAPSRAPEGFDLQAYIDSGSFEYLKRPAHRLPLRVRFDPSIGRHLYETPLSPDQTITKTDDQRLEIRATVKDTQQLRWWLLGFGSGVEVVEPADLREEFREIAQKMAARYQRR